LWCYDNELTAIDISKNTELTRLDCTGNPGNGVGTFPVKVWEGFNTTSPPTSFSKTAWNYEGETISPVYSTQ
jgi:hypothetical protein